jgi:hypothetical protein
MPDPIARLEFCRQEVDRIFGAGHAAANPELVSTMMLTAALDFAAIRLSAAIEQVALVLSEPESMPDNTSIVRASSLLHPRQAPRRSALSAVVNSAPSLARGTDSKRTQAVLEGGVGELSIGGHARN